MSKRAASAKRLGRRKRRARAEAKRAAEAKRLTHSLLGWSKQWTTRGAMWAKISLDGAFNLIRVGDRFRDQRAL